MSQKSKKFESIVLKSTARPDDLEVGELYQDESGNIIVNTSTGEKDISQNILDVPIPATAYLRAGRTTPQSVPNSTTTTIIYDTAFVQEDIDYNTSTGVATVRKPGKYTVSAGVALDQPADIDARIFFTVNGGQTRAEPIEPITTNNTGISGTMTIDLAEGDTFQIRFLQRNGTSATRNIVGGQNRNYFNMVQVQNDQPNATLETQGLINQTASARMVSPTTQNINTNALVNVTVTTVDFDTTGNMADSASSAFIIPESGFYRLHMNVAILGLSGSANNVVTAGFSVNGTVRSRIVQTVSEFSNVDTITDSPILELNEGDVVRLFVDLTNSFDTSYLIFGGSDLSNLSETFMSIARIPDFTKFASVSSKVYQTKYLQSDQTGTGANGTLSDLTFNNLTIGATYRVDLDCVGLQPPGIDNFNVFIQHDGQNVGLASMGASTSSGTAVPGHYGYAIFTASASTVTFALVGINNAGAGLRGNGTVGGTRATITELPDTTETTRFT